VTSPPDNLSELIGEDPLTRLELDWDLTSMRPELVRLGCMLQAAGVEEPGTILDAIQSDVERLVMVRDNAAAQKAAGTLVMASLNRALRKARTDCRFEPIEGEAAWKLQRLGDTNAAWPPWMLPELLVAFVGLAAIVAVSWFLFAGGAYSWLTTYLGLTVGAAVVSTKTKTSRSVVVVARDSRRPQRRPRMRALDLVGQLQQCALVSVTRGQLHGDGHPSLRR